MGSHQVLLNLLLQQVLNTVSNSNKSALLYMQRTNIHTCIHTFTHIIHTCALKQHGWHEWLHAALNYVDLVIAWSVTKTRWKPDTFNMFLLCNPTITFSLQFLTSTQIPLSTIPSQNHFHTLEPLLLPPTSVYHGMHQCRTFNAGPALLRCLSIITDVPLWHSCLHSACPLWFGAEELLSHSPPKPLFNSSCCGSAAGSVASFTCVCRLRSRFVSRISNAHVKTCGLGCVDFWFLERLRWNKNFRPHVSDEWALSPAPPLSWKDFSCTASWEWKENSLPHISHLCGFSHAAWLASWLTGSERGKNLSLQVVPVCNCMPVGAHFLPCTNFMWRAKWQARRNFRLHILHEWGLFLASGLACTSFSCVRRHEGRKNFWPHFLHEWNLLLVRA